MSLTASILSDAAQDNDRLVTVRYTDTDFNDVRSHRLKTGVDAQVFANAVAAGLDQGFIDNELPEIISGVSSGEVDPETVPLKYHTRNQLRKLMAKRLFNRMRNADTTEDRYEIIKAVLPLIGNYTDSQIANLVGWTSTQVANARAKLISFKNATDNLDHGQPEFSE